MSSANNTFASLSIRDHSASTYIIEHYDLPLLTQQKFLVIDLEATGLDYRNEAITEIAALPVVGGKILDDKAWSSFIKTIKPIPPDIQDLTGITDQDTQKGLPLRDALRKLTSEYGDYVWLAQCGFEFDFPFLDQEYQKHFSKPLPVSVLDTKVLYAFLHPEFNEIISTDYLLDTYGVRADKRRRHSAGGDVALLAEILQHILADFKNQDEADVQLETPLEIAKFIPE